MEISIICDTGANTGKKMSGMSGLLKKEKRSGGRKIEKKEKKEKLKKCKTPQPAEHRWDAGTEKKGGGQKFWKPVDFVTDV